MALPIRPQLVNNHGWSIRHGQGQAEVEQDQCGPGLASEAAGAAQEPRRLLAVAGDVQLHIEMMLGECFAGQQHVPGIVVDQENLGGAGRAGLVITGFPRRRPACASRARLWAGVGNRT